MRLTLQSATPARVGPLTPKQGVSQAWKFCCTLKGLLLDGQRKACQEASYAGHSLQHKAMIGEKSGLGLKISARYHSFQHFTIKLNGCINQPLHQQIISLPCGDMQLTWERMAKPEASRDLKSLASNFLHGRGKGEHDLLYQPLAPGMCRFQHHILSLKRHVALIFAPISVDIQPADDLSVHCSPTSPQQSPCMPHPAEASMCSVYLMDDRQKWRRLKLITRADSCSKSTTAASKLVQ